jgi:hypothetical protein
VHRLAKLGFEAASNNARVAGMQPHITGSDHHIADADRLIVSAVRHRSSVSEDVDVFHCESPVIAHQMAREVYAAPAMTL